MQQLRIGVIGVGNMGRNHVRILSEEERCFHLAGVYDADGARAQKIAEQFGTTAFQEMEPLLQAVEAVVIAVPSSLVYHAEAGGESPDMNTKSYAVCVSEDGVAFEEVRTI